MKKLGLATVTLSALLLLGCGSSGNKANGTEVSGYEVSAAQIMSNKAAILVYQNVSSGVCESEDFKTLLYNKGYRDFITQETANNTTCATYGKRVGNYCGQSILNSGNVNCVVGFNNYVGIHSTDDVSMYETFEILESELQ
jgi:hypothetical protein